MVKIRQTEYLAKLKGLCASLEQTEKLIWAGENAFGTTLSCISSAWEGDLRTLQATLSTLYDSAESVAKTTRESELFLSDLPLGKAPSVSALIAHSLEMMEIDLAPDIYQALIIAALLSDLENTVPYHNNQHYLKVVLQTLRLIVTHNDLFAGTEQFLDEKQQALLLIAACAHDLAHDGTGNMVKGVFKQSRLEEQSIAILEEYMQKVALSDQDMEYLRTMILSTDVTPLNDLANPVNQMKAAYRFHYRGDSARVDSLHLGDAMKALQKDEKLTVMSLLLHEADIATSAGISYAVTQYETILYRQEVCEDEACPNHVLDFLDNVCQRQFLSDAGQRLFGANMVKIYAQVSEEVKDGNASYGGVKNNALMSLALEESKSSGKLIN